MKVRIAFVTGPDGNIDVDRVGGIEDLPDDEARRLIRNGAAVVATDQELAEWDIELQRRAAAEADGLAAVSTSATKGELADAVQAPREGHPSAGEADTPPAETAAAARRSR